MNHSSRTILLLTLVLMATTYGLCPDKCMCKWKGGKETVECVNASLSRLPRLDPSTQVMDLSYNSLVQLQKDTFSSLGLLNLQKIYLSNCNIHTVTGRCFQGMTNLVELDLSYNLLQSIPEEALIDANYLMILTLTGNPIRRVTGQQLANLKYLQTLDLSSCQIKTVEAGAFADLNNLQWLKLDNNLMETISPGTDFPRKARGVSLNGNRWNCDCKLVGLRDFLHNRTVSFQIDPMCAQPEWISGQVIRELSDSELACLPQVSPTSSFEEVISGKNISLVCSVESTPVSSITWRYRGLLLKNGSTMVSDIDMRTYYYSNTVVEASRRVVSELVIQRASLEDSGVFQCEAENRAGIMVGNFTVSVVMPVPPGLPKERKVENRFKQEYFVLIGVTAVIISVLTIAISMIFIIKCRGARRGGAAANHGTQAGPHLYQCSVSDSSFSSDKNLMTVHHTSVSSASSRINCFTDSVSSSEFSASYIKSSHSYEQMEETPPAKDADGPAAKSSGRRTSSILKKTYSVVSFADVAGSKEDSSLINPFSHIILPEDLGVKKKDYIQLSCDPKADSDLISLPARSAEVGLTKKTEVGLTKKTEESVEDRPTDNHWHFSTLPRHNLIKSENLAPSLEQGVSTANLSLDLQHFVPVKKVDDLILPPPPQFKGVHFDPGTLTTNCENPIPQEGLPTLPAGQPSPADKSAKK